MYLLLLTLCKIPNNIDIKIKITGEIFENVASKNINVKSKNVNLSIILGVHISFTVSIMRIITPIPTPQKMFFIKFNPVKKFRIDAMHIMVMSGLKQMPIVAVIAPFIPFNLYPVKIEVFIAMMPGMHWLIE